MKLKLAILLLLVLLSSLVFFDLREDLQAQASERWMGTPGRLLKETDDRYEAHFQFFIHPETNPKMPSEDVLSTLKEIAKESGVGVVLTDFNTEENQSTYFLEGSVELDPLLVKERSWNESSEEGSLSFDDGIYNLSEPPLIKRVLKSMEQIESDFVGSEGTYAVTLLLPEEKLSLTEKLTEVPFMDFLNLDESFINEPYHETMKIPYPGLLMMILGLLLMFLCFIYVFKMRKNMAVRSLHGESVFSIWLHLFGRQSLFLVFLVFIIQVSLSFIFGLGFNPLSVFFYKGLFLINLILLFILLIPNLFSLFMISRTTYIDIKRESREKFTPVLMQVIKTVLFFIILSTITVLFTGAKDYLNLRSLVGTLQNTPYYVVTPTIEAEMRGASQDLQNLLFEEGMLATPHSIFNPDLIGTDDFNPEEIKVLLLTNNNFFQRETLLNEDGTSAKSDDSKNRLYLRADTEEESILNDRILSTLQDIEVKRMKEDEPLILPHDPIFFMVDRKLEGVLLLKEMPMGILPVFLMDQENIPMDEFMTFIEERGFFTGDVTLRSPAQDYLPYLERQMQLARKDAINLIFSVLAVLIMIIFVTSIFVDEHKKKLAISYLNGASRWRSYKRIFLSILISGGVLLILLLLLPSLGELLRGLTYQEEIVNLKEQLILLGAIVIGEILITLGLLKLLEGKTLQGLKGGE